MSCKSIKFSKESLAKSFYGKTTKEAMDQHTCIGCGNIIFITKNRTGKPGNIYSEAGMREYQITGLCETCFDDINDYEIYD